VVSYTLSQLYRLEKNVDTHWIESRVNLRAGLDIVVKRKGLTMSEVELRYFSP
jgi:hypothetical protein